MLMYGSNIMVANMIAREKDTVIYNLSSLNESYPRLYLLPPNELGQIYDFQFDLNYANWIIYTDPIFVEFMKIISNLYNGYNVYIIVSSEDWSVNIIDILMKLIQERYGVVGVQVNDYEDYLCGNETEFAEGYGLFTVQQDLERFGVLTYRVRKDDEYNV